MENLLEIANEVSKRYDNYLRELDYLKHAALRDPVSVKKLNDLGFEVAVSTRDLAQELKTNDIWIEFLEIPKTVSMISRDINQLLLLGHFDKLVERIKSKSNA